MTNGGKMIGTVSPVQAVMDLGLGGFGGHRGRLPVEVLERDGSGRSWLRLGGQWKRIVDIENLWELSAIDGGTEPGVGLGFRAVTEDGRTVRLVQDLCRVEWFQELTPAASTR